jgi:CHRD domain
VSACLTAVAAWTVTSKAASQSFKVTLNGAQQVPPVQTAATGTAELTYDPATRVLAAGREKFGPRRCVLLRSE